MPPTRRLLAVVLAASTSLTCQRVPSGTPAVESVPAAADEPSGPALHFPPPPSRHARPPLPRDLKATVAEAETGIVAPELDEDGGFEFSGQTLRIAFNDKITVDAGSPALVIEPEVAGELDTTDPYSLRFKAAQPFDPDASYTVKLGTIRDAKGKRIAEGWTATFRADPEVWIAGKVISYLPKLGTPRIVAMLPTGGIEVGPRPSFEVLFDQPLTTTQAEGLVELAIQGTLVDTKVPVRAEHPRGDVFGGVKVDREQVAIVRPAKALPGGSTLLFKRKDPDAPDYAEQYSVAGALTFDGVECYGYYGSECSWKPGVLKLPGNGFAVTYSNVLAVKTGKKAPSVVKVSPPVRNLSVYNDEWGTDGRLSVSGGFEPSTHYEVTIAPVRDKFGHRHPAVTFSVDTDPLGASASMPEGAQLLSGATAKSFGVTTRNVEKAILRLWKVDATAAAWDQAEQRVGNREKPGDTPTHEIAIEPKSERDKETTTAVDLASVLEPGQAYLASLELAEPAFDAKKPTYPEWSSAGRPPTALVTVLEPDAIVVRTHSTPRALLAHVAKVADGTPVEGATFAIVGQDLGGVATDKHGLAVLPVDATAAAAALLEVSSGKHRTQLRLGRGQGERELAQAYAGVPVEANPMRALIVTDRGVYRPGSKVFAKAVLRRVEGDTLPPVPSFPVRVTVTDPTGEQVFMDRGLTNEAGAIAIEFASSKTAAIGRYSITLEPWFGERTPLAVEQVQIAEFEPPRFAVDVSTTAEATELKGTVSGRYLFGAAMEGATASWTLRRSPAPIPGGSLADRGLVFRDDGDGEYWYDEESPRTEEWMRVGQGQLDAKGLLAITQAIELPKDGGPQSFVLEAEVADESHRTIANRSEVTVFDAERYAGVRLVERWQGKDTRVPVELGVVDRKGNPVAGTTVEATLERVTWERTRRPGPSGGEHVEWHSVRTEVARCSAETTTLPVSCDLVPRESGDYVVSAWVDGRRGGADELWVWGRGERAPVQPGHELELVADKASHAPGEKATVEFPNPFGDAIAIVTIEGGGELRTSSQRVSGTSGKIEIDVKAGDAPRMHTTVSLLPVGLTGEAALQWKFGALRLPVAMDDARLAVAVSSDRAVYEPGEKAQITVEVSRGGNPVSAADIALAVVDEGVLRLTDFHAIDPVDALRPAGGLSFQLVDQRDLLAALALRSHVAGDGASEGDQSLVSTRKDFVETALWRPDLVTDADGKATVELALPDNLTRFRMMAVVLDETGRGGVHEQGFEVKKPLMVIPAIPRFAILGDTFEAAALVHNETDSTAKATVSLAGETKEVEIEAHGRVRVPFSVTASEAGKQTYTFEVRDGEGTVRDRVEVALPVHAPGIDEHPRLAAGFTGAQDVVIEVPADAFVGEDDDLVVTTGITMWPELGARLEYLVDYPHGCVEQTTSSTLPLLAARELLPRLGFTRYTREQIDARIAAGVARLASMKTSDGGLAYWPGQWPSNPYGTAYAMRALVRARDAGIVVPSGLIEGMEGYLKTELAGSSVEPGSVEVRSAIALALAEAKALPPAMADALYDARKNVGPFGLATLALVLASVPEQDERVTELLDLLEAEFDEKGHPKTAKKFEDFAYYGSSQRTRAQAALALERLRPSSALLPALVDTIIADTDSYTTQSTAFGLIALTERLRHMEVEDAAFAAALDGEPIYADPIETVKLGGGAMRWTIPLSKLRGKSVRLRVTSSSDRAVSLLVEAQWRRPFAATASLQATSTKHGPDVYRLYTDPVGKPIDLADIAPGDIVRVGIVAKMPTEAVERSRIGYVAITDRIPAGFEPIQPDLATVAQTPELDPEHPLAQMMGWGGAEASHTELHDDRVDLYFDRVWGDWVAASYLVRATTPGDFIAAPARAELMYEPDSTGFSDTTRMTVKP